MKSTHEVSKHEVWFAIRYLDPDFNRDCENRNPIQRVPFLVRSMKISGLVAAVTTIFYLVQRYLPTMIRLLN